MHSIVGVFSDEGPPVPIPNTVVKLISADNTWLEAAREDKAMPTQQRTTVTTVVFVFIYSLRLCLWQSHLPRQGGSVDLLCIFITFSE